MSLDKAIKYGKEHRKPYTGSKVYFRSCRNHGDCPYCRENRLHKFRDKHPYDRVQEERFLLNGLKETDHSSSPIFGRVV